MSYMERKLYRSVAGYALNQLALPLKLVVPQPIIAKIPLLTTNLAIRIGVVGQLLSGFVLDVGCGGNLLIKAYRKRGGDGIGVDLYPLPGVDQLVENTAKLDYPDHSLETIT